MKFTLRQIEVFLATAHEQNISLAAQRLSMSQSAASGALKNLEDTYDVQLFDRVGKKLQINEQGLALRTRAEALMAMARDLDQALLKHADVGPLKVGATLTIGNYIAVNIVAHFMREHPEAKVSLEVANTTMIAKKVLNYELDIGLVEGEINHPELEIIPWHQDELAVFCSPEHALAQYCELSDKALTRAPWILRESGSGTRQAFDWAMHGLLSQLHILLELQHTEAIKRAVEAGLGIGCLSRVTLEDAFRRGSLIHLPVPQRDFKRQFYFVLNKSKYRSSGVKQWMALCESFYPSTHPNISPV
ncbi:MAG: LysR family transcriptional regulator [Hahellaceae bacterium]|nr:LysR family transcriptional regulator [Hahellaceae bacterium]MCP5211514.1 LysR family transcriptional regulator [Hahellaceae bacterium]